MKSTNPKAAKKSIPKTPRAQEPRPASSTPPQPSIASIVLFPPDPNSSSEEILDLTMDEYASLKRAAAEAGSDGAALSLLWNAAMYGQVTAASSPDDLVDRLENHIQKWRFIVEGSRDDNLDAIWSFGSDLLSDWDKLRKEVNLKLGRTITRRSVEPTKEGA